MAQLWDYRVVRKKEDNGSMTFGIHEVFYDKHGKPQFCSNRSMEPTGESIRDLRASVVQMMKAFNKPILRYEDF